MPASRDEVRDQAPARRRYQPIQEVVPRQSETMG